MRVERGGNDVGLRALSLFSGIGGLDLGVRIARPDVRTVCYVERDEFCQRVIQARIADGALDDAPIWSDITDFDGRPWRGRVDVIIGGFPCQDISVAGRGAGLAGERSGLWREYSRLICEIRPRYVFVENVANLLSIGMGDVLGDLSTAGYDAQWGAFRASDVGAPHRRERVFILAYARRGSDDANQSEPVAQRGGETIAREVGADVEHANNARLEGWGLPGRERGGERLTGEAECAVAHAGYPATQVAASDDLLGAQRSTNGWGHEQPTGARTGGRVGDGDFAAGVDANRQAAAGDEATDRDNVGDAAGDLWGASEDGVGNASNGAGNLGLFPPGPGHVDAWRDIIARYPELSPATEKTTQPYVRRVVDGRAFWVDPAGVWRVRRLHALGNAVMPWQATLAWSTLWERMTEDD